MANTTSANVAGRGDIMLNNKLAFWWSEECKAIHRQTSIQRSIANNGSKLLIDSNL
jgi:hypothetical protein